MAKNRNEQKQVANIEIRQNTYIPKDEGFFKPSFNGPISYYDRKTTLLVSRPHGKAVAMQYKFTYTAADGKVAKGWFGCNKYTGRAHVEVTEPTTFASLQELSIVNDARRMVFKAINTMGAINYESYLKAAKRKKEEDKTESKHVTMLSGETIIDFQPGNINKPDVDETDETPHRRAAREDFAPAVRTYNVASWARKGTYCRRGKLVYWREGGICHRHVLNRKEEDL